MLVLALPEEAQLSGCSFQNVTEQVGAFLACLFWLLFPLPNHNSISQLFLCLLFSFFRILAWISPTFKSSVTSLMTANILATTLSYLWDVFLVSSTVVANSVSSDSNSLSPIPFLPSDFFSYSLDSIHTQASTLPNRLGSPFQALLVLKEV